jgi:hypothetical protein
MFYLWVSLKAETKACTGFGRFGLPSAVRRRVVSEVLLLNTSPPTGTKQTRPYLLALASYSRELHLSLGEPFKLVCDCFVDFDFG